MKDLLPQIHAAGQGSAIVNAMESTYLLLPSGGDFLIIEVTGPPSRLVCYRDFTITFRSLFFVSLIGLDTLFELKCAVSEHCPPIIFTAEAKFQPAWQLQSTCLTRQYSPSTISTYTNYSIALSESSTFQHRLCLSMGTPFQWVHPFNGCTQAC